LNGISRPPPVPQSLFPTPFFKTIREKCPVFVRSFNRPTLLFPCLFYSLIFHVRSLNVLSFHPLLPPFSRFQAIPFSSTAHASPTCPLSRPQEAFFSLFPIEKEEMPPPCFFSPPFKALILLLPLPSCSFPGCGYCFVLPSRSFMRSPTRTLPGKLWTFLTFPYFCPKRKKVSICPRACASLPLFIALDTIPQFDTAVFPNIPVPSPRFEPKGMNFPDQFGRLVHKTTGYLFFRCQKT